MFLWLKEESSHDRDNPTGSSQAGGLLLLSLLLAVPSPSCVCLEMALGKPTEVVCLPEKCVACLRLSEVPWTGCGVIGTFLVKYLEERETHL